MSLHNNGRPKDLAQYTLATLPTAADHLGSLVFVTDANGGQGAVAVSRQAGGSPAGEVAGWYDVATYAVVA